MNFEEIKVKLKELDLTNLIMGSFGQNGEYYDYNEDDDEIDVEELLKNNFGEVKVVEKSYFHDGYECHVVFHFEEHNVYIMYSGYYSSYNGTRWNNTAYEVLPEKKTITVYNKIIK